MSGFTFTEFNGGKAMYQIIRKVHNENGKSDWALTDESNNPLYFETHWMAVNYMKDLFELHHLTSGQMLTVMESQNVHIKSVDPPFWVKIDLGRANWSEIVPVSSETYNQLLEEIEL